MDTDLGRMKGVVFREFVLWYERELGDAELLRSVNTLAAAERELVDPQLPAMGILAGSWYPAKLAHALLDGLTEGMGPLQVETLARQAGIATMTALMTGLQRLAFSMLMTPKRYQSYVQRIWNMNYDSGEIEVRAMGPTSHLGFIRSWRGHHALICRMTVAGKGPIYEAMGCKNVVVTPKTCVAWGDDACSSAVDWDE